MNRFVALLPLLGACAHAAPPVTAPPALDVKPLAAAAKPANGIEAIVLWDGASEELAADGTVRNKVDGFRIAAGARILTVKQEEVTAKLGCDSPEGSHYDGDFHSKSLLLTDASGVVLTLVPPSERVSEENVMVDDGMTSSLEAVVGPYLFVKVERSSFGCGAAHPMRSVEAAVWNAENGKEVTLTLPAGLAERAREALKDRGSEAEQVTFAEAIPELAEDGRLSLRWRFEKPASYMESDSAGSAYTVSTVVESDVLPVELEAFANAPPSVASYLRAHPHTALVGWSRLRD